MDVDFAQQVAWAASSILDELPGLLHNHLPLLLVLLVELLEQVDGEDGDDDVLERALEIASFFQSVELCLKLSESFIVDEVVFITPGTETVLKGVLPVS